MQQPSCKYLQGHQHLQANDCIPELQAATTEPSHVRQHRWLQKPAQDHHATVLAPHLPHGRLQANT
jgi:hypothetical protein